MRKILLTLILFSGIVVNSKSQHFTASFGVQHSWGVPVHVTRMVHDHYYGYEWVHATRAHRSGSMFFDLVLQRGDIFVEVSVRNDGYISRRVVREYYPLHDHVCSTHCGYHNTYYTNYYKSCNSHHHTGHNHVVYSSRPPQGHAHGYYKNYDKHHGKGYYKDDKKHGHYESKQSTRVVYRNDDNDRSRGYESRRTIERRDRYYGSRSYDQERRRSDYKDREDHDKNKGHDNKYRGHDKGRDHNKDRKEDRGRSRGASFVTHRGR